MKSNRLGRTLLSVSVATTMAIPAAAQDASQVPYENTKTVAFATGKCTYRLNGSALTPCHHSIVFVTLKTGRSFFHFTKEDAFFAFSGGSDRQPNLENYYLSLDRVRFGRGQRDETGPVEGECHVRMTRQGKFRHIQCDAYNRANGLNFSFTLANISSMNHRSF